MPPQARILIIEDDPDVRENLGELLELEGYFVELCPNGEAGVRAALAAPPELILCDVMMPGLDGYGVLRSLRTHAAFSTVPFLFLTAKSAQHDFREGMNLGADDYLSKPCDSHTLLHAVRTRLAKRDQARRLFGEKLELLESDLRSSIPSTILTPLAGIQRFSEVLLEHGATLDPASLREIATDIRDGARRLQDLLEDFILFVDLEAAQRDSGRLPAQPLAPASSLLREAAHRKAADFHRESDLIVTLDAESPTCPRLAFARVFSALLDNAFRYSQRGSLITVSNSASPNAFSFSIQDQGPGISAEQLDHIRTLAATPGSFRQRSASGLGLVLSHQVVRLAGGSLDFQRTPAGGTLVTLSLPRR